MNIPNLPTNETIGTKVDALRCKVNLFNDAGENRWNECKELLEQHPTLFDSFEHCIQSLCNISTNTGNGSKPNLSYDFADYSFGFSSGYMIGGMIFHGSPDVSLTKDPLSIQLVHQDGWSLHT